MTSRAGRAAWLGALLVALVAAGYGGWSAGKSWRRPEAVPAASAPVRAPAPDTLVDPLSPGRVVALDPAPRAAGSADWVTARPGFQYSRSSAERGGVNPCAIPAGDTSSFEAWTNLGKGRFSAPRAGALDAEGRFDLVFHLHGDELARRELVRSGQKLVLYSLTVGADESYAGLFSGSKLFGQLVEQVEQSLARSHGVGARVRNVALSAWSAGYMGALAILVQPEARDVDAVILIDGLHGPRGELERHLAPFVEFARRAVSGERFLLVTHSSIDPPDFASTTESAHSMLAALGARPTPVRRDDGLGLELIEYFTNGNFHVRGYAGNDKADHCAQVTLLSPAYSALARRWQAPGTAAKPERPPP